MSFDLLLTNAEIVFPAQTIRTGHIGINDGTIAAILEPSSRANAKRVIDCRNRWILPGVIDPHTHIGFGDKENDWASETATAALGGATGLMSFWRHDDLDSSTSRWIAAGQATARTDFGLHFGVTSRRHVDEFAALSAKYGVTSLKVYLMYKGATGAAKGFTEVDDALLFSALQAGAQVKNGVVGVHCENTEVIPIFREPLQAAGRDDLAAWDEQSPGFLETENVFRVAFFAEKAGCDVNIVHMSAVESLDLVRGMRNANRPKINVETCIHYLTLTHQSPVGSIGKVNPPLRSQADVDGLWEGVRSGDIQTIGSDHVPRKVATKGPDIWSASAGFPGIAQVLPVLISEGHFNRGIPLEQLIATTSCNVADLYSLPNKGRIAPGYDADFAIVDPDGQTIVAAEAYPSFSDYSPYEGAIYRGAVTHTILRGQLVVEDGQIVPGSVAHGRYLHRAP